MSVGAGFLAAALSPALALGKESQARPNILWLVSEDNNPLIGAYGDKLAHTPAIDGLARRGLLYRHVYANAPVCALSRFGIVTGVYAESCGPAHHMRANAKVAGVLKTYPQYLRDAGYYCTNNAKTDYNCDIDPQQIWDESSETAHWRHRPDGKLFMAVFNFLATHESSIFKVTDGRVTPTDVKVPAYLPDTPEIRRDIASYYNRIEIMDGQVADRLAELEADGLADSTIVFYYSDHGGALPRSKRFCYDEGLRASLVIAMPPRYAHLAPVAMGNEIETPTSFIDLAPTVLALAGIGKPAQMAGHALLGQKPIRTTRYVFGARNRMDERYDMTRTITDGRFRYIRNYMPNRPWGQHYSYPWQMKSYQQWERLQLAGKLTNAQRRFFGHKPYEELYDVASDPDESINLLGRATELARLTELRTALDEHLLSINDNGFIPEGSPREGYTNTRTPGAYPLQRIMAVAAAAARGDTDQLDAFVAGLKDADEIIRYWCAHGLLVLRTGALTARGALRRSMDEDSSPHVRIVAAEALAGLDDDPGPAVNTLADLLDRHPVHSVRLQAINALTFVGASAGRVLPAIERAASAMDPEDWTVRAAARYLSVVLRGQYDPSYPTFDPAWFKGWWERTSTKRPSLST